MKNGGYVLKKRCRICRESFRPNVRVGNRQIVCGKDACKKLWKQRKNQEAYKKERDYHRGRTLRKKLASEGTESGQTKGATTRCALQLPKEDIEEVMGAPALVVLEFLLMIVFRRNRHGPF